MAKYTFVVEVGRAYNNEAKCPVMATVTIQLQKQGLNLGEHILLQRQYL